MSAWAVWSCAAGCLIGAVGAAWSCSAQRDVSAEPAAPQTPFSPLGAETSGSPSEAPGNTPLALDELAPLLSEGRLSAVQVAVDEERFEEALETYQQALKQDLAEVAPQPQYQFQLGRLADLAEDYSLSAKAFEQSAGADWPLKGYARYFWARALLRSGDAPATLEVSRTLPETAAYGPANEVLRAEAAIAQNKPELAIPILQRHLQREPLPYGWPRAALLLAEQLLERAKTQKSDDINDRLEALRTVRRVSIPWAGSKTGDKAAELEKAILGSLSAEAFKQHQMLTSEQQRDRLESLVETRNFSDALVVADELKAQLEAKNETYSDVGCEALVLKNKALFGTRKYTKAVDGFADVLRFCKDAELRPKALYLAGKYAAIDKRHSQAVRHFRELERDFSKHRLADDARLLRARSHLEMGDEANFTRALSQMADDYPDGDMVLDGVFELALRRIERNDWGGAASVLERGLKLARVEDARRDHEWAGRERYFLARAWIEGGERERGLAEFEALIRERPLSYYMQHAYSRLLKADQARARTARAEAIAATLASPFHFQSRPEFQTDAFQRALWLLRQGELEWAQRELSALESVGEAGAEQAPELLWSMALLYNRAGSPTLSHRLARGQLTDWLSRWPVGDWEKAWQLAFPRPYRNLVGKAAEKYELPEALIYAVMREESGFDARVVSPADAYGLMQLIKPTAKHYGKKAGLPYSPAALKIPRINILLGASVLKDFQGYFPNNPLLGIPGYNAGPGRPKRWMKERPGSDFDVWVELIPFRETRRYTKRVLSSRGAYAFLYESQDSEHLLLPEKLVE